MIEYVTIAVVDDLLGDDWATTDKKANAVMQANVWLNTKKFCYYTETVPAGIQWAGAYLARMSANGTLYTSDTEGVVTEKRVKADTVEVQKKYADGQETGKSFEMKYVDDLMKPYLCKDVGVGFARVCK